MTREKLISIVSIIITAFGILANGYSLYFHAYVLLIIIVNIFLFAILLIMLISASIYANKNFNTSDIKLKEKLILSENKLAKHDVFSRQCLNILSKAVDVLLKIYPANENSEIKIDAFSGDGGSNFENRKLIIDNYENYINSIDLDSRQESVESKFGNEICDSIVKTIPKVVEMLKYTIKDTENATFNIIDKFEKLASENANAKKEAEENLEKIMKEVDGKNFDTILAESKGAIDRYREQIESSMELFNKLLALNKEDEKKLMVIDQWIDNINAKLVKINEISERNRIIAINTSIEASRLGDKGEGFRILAYEIRKLNESTNLFIRDINSIMNSFRNYNRDFVRDWTTRTDSMINKIETAEPESEEIISKLINSYLLSIGSFVRLVESTGIIDKNLYKLLESLQFQDINRQQIEKVIAFLCEINNKIGEKKYSFESNVSESLKKNSVIKMI